jgi:hypothetical protein
VGQQKTTPNLGLTLDLLPCISPGSCFHAIARLKHILSPPQSLFRPETLLPELPEPNDKQQSVNRLLIRPLHRHATTGTFRPIDDTLPYNPQLLSPHPHPHNYGVCRPPVTATTALAARPQPNRDHHTIRCHPNPNPDTSHSPPARRTRSAKEISPVAVRRGRQ